MIKGISTVMKKMQKSFDSDSMLIAAVMRQYVTRDRLSLVLSDVQSYKVSPDYAVELFRMYVLKTFHHENPGMNECAIHEALNDVNNDIVNLVKDL